MQHGGDLGEARRLFGTEHAWLDLSTGINPHPWPIRTETLTVSDWTRLPSADDRDALLAAARRAYAAPRDVTIVAAPGTQALIQWLPHVAPPGGVAILAPTYGEHAASWRDAGRAVIAVSDPDQVPATTAHLVVVNPNNPDGRIVGIADLRAAAERCAQRGGWLVIDESFADVTPGASAIGHTGDLPVLVLRSFGKFFGLAGLRLGFALGPAAVVDRLARALGPWAVPTPALAIGRAALGDCAWAEAMRVQLEEEARALDAILARGGGEIVGGTSLFRLVRRPRAADLHRGLAMRGIWVRAFDWAPDLLRVGLPADRPAFDRVAEAWGALA